MQTTFDVIVVGGGPGGYVAAIRAAQLGLSTALIEKQHLGGICLNWGCIPTKALLQGAETARTLAHAAEFGFATEVISFDIQGLVKRSRDIAAQLTKGVSYLMQKNAVTVIDGHARLTAKGQLQIQGNNVGNNAGNNKEIHCRGDHIILATGARPRTLPGIEPDGKLIWSYFEAMVPQQLPRSLLVIGSGAIGMEFASLYSGLGSDVTIVEAAERLMPAEDTDISMFAAQQFNKQRINVHTATTVGAVDKHQNAVTCTLIANGGSATSLTVDRVIVAVGVQGNSDDLGLQELGCETDNSFIKTDRWCRTNVAGLYAIGDVSGPPCLAHKASHEGRVCVDKLAGVADVKPLLAEQVPGCTYCYPQIASIGLTEGQARARGHVINVGRFDLQANGKALALGDSEGFVKTIFDANSGELLGAHMVGPEVTEQIQGFAIARGLEACEVDLINTVFAHPTLSEAMHEAVLDAYGRGLHQ